MLLKGEVEELILGMAQVVREKRFLEEENKILKRTLKERDDMINEYLDKTNKDVVTLFGIALTRSMKNIDELSQEA